MHKKKSEKSITGKKQSKKHSNSCVLVICAHNDDQLLGVGGTIRKYVNEGIKVYTYIFSYGETSHPHLKPEIIAKTREQESIRASKILGDNINYFGLKEGNFTEVFDKNILKDIILKKKPSRIFTHSPDDPHPDHQAVFTITKEVLKSIKSNVELYTFDVWNLFTIRTRNYPKLFVDISDTFKVKIKAFDMHKSQMNTKITLGWSIYLKAILSGWNNHCKYAEVFYKIPLADKKDEK